jgi:hypothetical protein
MPILVAVTRAQKRFVLLLIVLALTVIAGNSMIQQAAQQQSQGISAMCRAGTPAGQSPDC